MFPGVPEERQLQPQLGTTALQLWVTVLSCTREHPPPPLSGILVPWTWVLFRFICLFFFNITHCEIVTDNVQFYFRPVILESSHGKDITLPFCVQEKAYCKEPVSPTLLFMTKDFLLVHFWQSQTHSLNSQYLPHKWIVELFCPQWSIRTKCL